MKYQINEIFKAQIETYLKNHELYSAYGKITKVNNEFCEVDLDGKAPIGKVRLYFNGGDFCLIPKTGSKCIITFISSTEAVLSLVEKIDKICINAQDKIIFGDGKNGGLVISGKLSDALNKIINEINLLKQAISSAPIIPLDGGLTFKTYLTSAWASKPLNTTTKKQFENSKIEH